MKNGQAKIIKGTAIPE